MRKLQRRTRLKTPKKKDASTFRGIICRLLLIGLVALVVVRIPGIQQYDLSVFTVKSPEEDTAPKSSSVSETIVGKDPVSTTRAPVHVPSKLPATAKFRTNFCVPWETNTDEWWVHHPDWFLDVTAENSTHTCFQQLQGNPNKTQFLRTIFQHQWHGNCDHAIYMESPSISFNFDTWQDQWHPLVQGLAKGKELSNQPFQLVVNSDQKCPERGTMDCFFLPLSHCPSDHIATHTPSTLWQSDERGKLDQKLTNHSLHYRWYQEYLLRPQSWLRKQIRDSLQSQLPSHSDIETSSCAVLHVDKSHGPAIESVVKQYGSVLKDRILVVSEDNPVTTSEAQRKYPQYQWIPLGGKLTSPNKVEASAAASFLGIFLALQWYHCELLVTPGTPQDQPLPFSSYLYWELVAALNQPEAGQGSSFFKEIQALRGEETLLKHPKVLTVDAEPTRDEQSAGLGIPENVYDDHKEATKPSLPPLMVPQDYAEYDDYRNEYRLKLDISTANVGDDTLCAPWQVNGDYWWTHHRDWEVGPENETHYCFKKVSDAAKARYFRDLYKIQFGHMVPGINHCDQVIVKRMWSSGWGADMFNVVDGLHHAYRQSKPVQIQESTPWHYAFPKRSVDSAKGIRAACQLKNMYCYLLNMTDCSSYNKTTADSSKNPYLEDPGALYFSPQYRWYIEWLVRPQTWLRKRVYDYIQQQAPKIETPCTAMHVRRNDVVLHNTNARKFHSIKEYIEATNGTIRRNILLMTDDHNAIGEATSLWPQFNWMYLDRPRFGGVGGWEHQTPSDDPVLEVVVLFTLFRLIRHCDQFVMSAGKFSSYLHKEMVWNRDDDDEVQIINIDNDASQQEVLNPANYKTHIISKNYDPEDVTRDTKKKMLTAGGKRFVGEPIPRDKEFDGPFCQTWDVDADEWWTHHPTWEMGAENQTHYCFQPIRNAAKAKLLYDLYKVQFVDGDCNQVVTKRMWSSGWGADFENVIDGLIHATKKRKPVQVGLERWHYADPSVKQSSKTKMNGSGIACPRRSMFCYFLEICRCEPKVSWKGDWLEDPLKGQAEYTWYLDFATRPQTWLRKRVYDFVQKQREEYFGKNQCAVIHVRRGDVIFHETDSRKYHAIKEYIDFAKTKDVVLHENVFLLSDDRNAFAEAKANFPEYNWMQIDRPRKEAKDAKWEEHLVSEDPIFEMVVIQSIFRMVKQCDQLLYSSSNFADHIRWEMESSGKSIVRLNIDEGKEYAEIYNKQHVHTRNISTNFDG